MGETKQVTELLTEKEREGKIVIMTIDGPMEADLTHFLEQPVEGILYDLNRGKEVVLLRVGKDPKWVNDYAVATVITTLYKERADLRATIASLRQQLDAALGQVAAAERERDAAVAKLTPRCTCRKCAPELYPFDDSEEA